MKLTKEEEALIRNRRAAKQSKLGKYSKAILDRDGEPTGRVEMTEDVLEALLSEIDKLKIDASAWSRHVCSGEEA